MVFFAVSSTGALLTDQVQQTPADMYKNPNETATLRCLHTISTYNRILWYKQSGSGQLQLLGYMWGSSPALEAHVSGVLGGSAEEHKNCTLTIQDLQQDSSAVYFCAASFHSVICGCCSTQKPPTTRLIIILL